jgi:hypothetical protein
LKENYQASAVSVQLEAISKLNFPFKLIADG